MDIDFVYTCVYNTVLGTKWTKEGVYNLQPLCNVCKALTFKNWILHYESLLK